MEVYQILFLVPNLVVDAKVSFVFNWASSECYAQYVKIDLKMQGCGLLQKNHKNDHQKTLVMT